MTATPELVLDVEIAADGAWMLDGEPIARDELPVRVAAARASHASQPVRAVLRASETTPHARVVEVMNSLRAVGVTQFAIDLRPDERAP